MLLMGGLSALLFSCEKDGKKQEFYYPEPTVTGIYPTNGYTLSQVAINGENFGDRMEPISVFFGDKEAEIVSCKNNRIVTVVPEGASSGDVMLKVWQYEFESVGKFTVVPKPSIVSVSSNNAASPRLADVGDEITITGTSFGDNADDVVAKVGDVTAEIISVTNEEMKIEAPAGYGLGAVSLSVRGYEISGDYLLESSYTGDVTAFALKNYSMPFDYYADTKKGVWYVPADWMMDKEFHPVIYDNRNDNGRISFLSTSYDSNSRDLVNDKMYQVTTLPAGKYTFTLSISACGFARTYKSFGVLFGVTSGDKTLPDVNCEGRVCKPADESAFIGNSYVVITDEDYAHDAENLTLKTEEITVTLAKSTTVTIGFVAHIVKNGTGGANVDITNIQIEKTE